MQCILKPNIYHEKAHTYIYTPFFLFPLPQQNTQTHNVLDFGSSDRTTPQTTPTGSVEVGGVFADGFSEEEEEEEEEGEDVIGDLESEVMRSTFRTRTRQ